MLVSLLAAAIIINKSLQVTLQHTETVLAACSRPPRAPTAAAMTDLIKRFTAPGGGSVFMKCLKLE